MTPVPTKPPIATKKSVVPVPRQSLTVPLNVIDKNVVNTIVLYGESGLGKSTEARRFALWLYARTGKPVRLIFVESSSQKIFESLVKTGIVDPFFLLSAESSLAAFRKLSKGQWPMKDEQGKTVWRTTGDCSGYIFEGMTSIAEALLEEVRENHWLLREQASDAFDVGGEKFAPASRSGYGFVQSEMLRAIKEFASLPVERNLWTAHESKGKEEDGGATVLIYGPALVGSAKTASIQKYCGLLIHYENYATQKKLDVKETVQNKAKDLVSVENKIRAWFVRHQDLTLPNVFYPAKTTIPAPKVPSLFKTFPHGFYEPTLVTGLEKFLDVEAKLLSEETLELEDWKKGIDAKFKKA